MLDDLRKPEGERTELIVERLKNEEGYYTGYLYKGELVRCKECKWAEVCSQNVAMRETYDIYEKIDFCSYGEREGE